MKFGSPTRKGLPFKGKIPKVDEEGAVKDRTDEAWHSIKHGLVKGVSIGFLPQEYNYKDDGGVHYDKAAVHELSLTAIPCNPEAMITAFKSLQASDDAAAFEVPGEYLGHLPQAEQPGGASAAPPDGAATPEETAKAAKQAETIARLLSVRLYS